MKELLMILLMIYISLTVFAEHTGYTGRVNPIKEYQQVYKRIYFDF